jgi:hypothetical protein
MSTLVTLVLEMDVHFSVNFSVTLVASTLVLLL